MNLDQLNSSFTLIIPTGHKLTAGILRPSSAHCASIVSPPHAAGHGHSGQGGTTEGQKAPKDKSSKLFSQSK